MTDEEKVALAQVKKAESFNRKNRIKIQFIRPDIIESKDKVKTRTNDYNIEGGENRNEATLDHTFLYESRQKI